MRARRQSSRIERAYAVPVQHHVAHRSAVVKEREIAGWRGLPTVAYRCGDGEGLCVDCRISARHQRRATVRGEVDFQYRMQLDTIWSHSRLPVDGVAEADALHLDLYVRGLAIQRCVERGLVA